MAQTGQMRKSKKQQKIDEELGAIIDEFGKAMWGADKRYIMTDRGNVINFTPNMQCAWQKYIEFCERNFL
jgi:hypothetical protein